MKKINKQVAKSKISSFLEINQVVLFFHCKNSVSLNKNDNFLDLNKIQVTSQAYGECVAGMNGANRSGSSNNAAAFNTTVKEQNGMYKRKEETLSNQNTFKSIMVKNRLAKKAFLELNQRKPLYCLGEDMILKKGECFFDSLFQGPILLLGCSNVEMLERGIHACAKHKSLILIGALYDKFIISHSQVKRLITNSNKNRGHVRLIYSMINPLLRPLSLIQTLLSMPCFLAKQERLIYLLETRKQQMLVAHL
uniref:50S ribosomal protein L10 n=1 Tax=Chloroidium sp. UTEX 3077 TaxID=2686440 RepID=A0A6B9ERQ2_9CHLO|nr:50S ribosomal protein L10 [Chloroidium sp. UTEX 3077]